MRVADRPERRSSRLLKNSLRSARACGAFVHQQPVSLPPRVRGAAVAVLLVLLGSLPAASPAQAHAWFEYGIGARAIGMGNAYAALADDPSAAYDNPAGLVAPVQPSVSLGFDYLAYDFRIDGATADLPNVPSLVFGTTFPIPLEKLIGMRAAFGFGLQMTGATLLDQSVPFPTVPQFVVHQNSARVLHLLPALAFEPVPGVEVGGGAMFFDNTVGALDLGIGARGDATFQVDQELKTIVSPLAGIRLDGGALAPPLAGWHAGLVYRGSFSVPYSIPVNAFLGGLPLVLDFSATALYTPAQVECGLAYSPNPDWNLAAEVLWNEWSKFPDPALKIGVDITIPVLPIVFNDSLLRDPNFHDTVSGRLGVEGRVASWTSADLWLRLGYAYEPTPAPEQTGETNFLDNDRHIVSAGLGVALLEAFGDRLPHPLHLDSYLQAQILPSRTHHKDADVSQDNPGFPSISSDGILYHAGLALSTELELLDR